jgi:endonuclease YncB( thermonuclease family)
MELITYLLLPILIALVITAQTASTLSDLIGKASKVIDGDTIIVKPKIGKKIEVRLDMVDTPEIV